MVRSLYLFVLGFSGLFAMQGRGCDDGVAVRCGFPNLVGCRPVPVCTFCFTQGSVPSRRAVLSDKGSFSCETSRLESVSRCLRVLRGLRASASAEFLRLCRIRPVFGAFHARHYVVRRCAFSFRLFSAPVCALSITEAFCLKL